MTKTKKSSLRPDTTVSPAEGGREIYIREMPACCLRSLKVAAIGGPEERRFLSLECLQCGREWRVTSSLDERVLGAFVTHAGPRVGGGSPAA